MESLRSEKQKLETTNKLLQEPLDAKDQVIKGYEKLMAEITSIILRTEQPQPKPREETLEGEELE